MSSRNWRVRLQDILSCCYNIRSFTSGMNINAFLGDAKTIRAVAFELTTVGEAACAIPKEVQEKHPEIPWEKMKGTRNILVHEYFRVDEEILWKTVQDDIPRLITTLEKIIKE